jgi:predicted porin
MNKKVMAVAVAGALAAPAMALAQTTIYGVFNAEYGFVSQSKAANGDVRHDAEGFNSGASRIGFKGEEKIGGGLVAWYQCESQLDLFPRDLGTTLGAATWCGRNSAVGIKGDFGNFYVGTWDSPIKRASGVTRITNETGWLGSQHMTLNPPNPASFSDRLTDSFTYDTPKLGAFSGSIQITSLQATLNATSAAVVEGRILGLSGQYDAGPATVVVAYSKKDENRATGTAATAENKAWIIGAAYVFGPAKVGFTYISMETQPTATTNLERKAWNLAGDYNLPGPGTVRVGYALADDLKGNGAGAGASTGAKQWQISYLHSFSKRTQGALGYVKLDNDSAGVFNLTGLDRGSANVLPGESPSAFVLSITHSF